MFQMTKMEWTFKNFQWFYLLVSIVGFNCAILNETTLDHHQLQSAATVGCIPRPSHQASTNQTWKLVWQDQFDNPSGLNLDEWTVEHETQFCSGNGIRQVSCNTNRTANVRVSNGYLSLVAQYEPYFEHQYTAATITTKRYFSYGRYEFRAALPLGDFIRVSIFTRDDQELYWHESGQIDLMSNKQEAILYRGLHFANSTSSYQSADYIVSASNRIDTDLSKFHRYGIEWNQQELRFFYDTHFSSPFIFNQNDRSMESRHQIRLQIGVGGILFGSQLPEEFDKLKWKCPAFVVDYVRIYEPVDMTDEDAINGSSSSLCPSLDGSENITYETENAERLQICLEAMQGLPTLTSSQLFTTTQLIILLIVIFLVLFLTISGYLLIQVNRVRRTVEESDQYGTRTESGLYEHCQYDMYEYDLDKRSSGIYSTLTGQPKGNDYLEIGPENQQQQTTNFHINPTDGSTITTDLSNTGLPVNNNNNNNRGEDIQYLNMDYTKSVDKIPKETNRLIDDNGDT